MMVIVIYSYIYHICFMMISPLGNFYPKGNLTAALPVSGEAHHQAHKDVGAGDQQSLVASEVWGPIDWSYHPYVPPVIIHF